MMQQHAELVKALQRANDLIDKKLLDQASKERIAAITAQAQVVGFTMKANSAAGLQMATQDFQRLTQALDQDHDRILAQHTAAKEIVLQQMQNDGQQRAAAAQPEPAGVEA